MKSYIVVVRNNVSGGKYSVSVDLDHQEAKAVARVGEMLTNRSDWDITMTVVPVSPGKIWEGK